MSKYTIKGIFWLVVALFFLSMAIVSFSYKSISIDDASLGDKVTKGKYTFTIMDVSDKMIRLSVVGGHGGSRIISHSMFERYYKAK